MKEVVILADDRDRGTNLITLMNMLFPEIKARLVFLGNETMLGHQRENYDSCRDRRKGDGRR